MGGASPHNDASFKKMRHFADIIDRDVAILTFSRDLFEEFGDTLRSNARLRLGHFFFNAVGEWWFDSLTLAVRRLIGRGHKTISLYRLAKDVLEHVEAGKSFAMSGTDYIDAAQIRTDLDEMVRISERARHIADRTVAHRDERGFDEGLVWRGACIRRSLRSSRS